MGISLGHYDINSQRQDLDDFEESLLSIFINWQQGDHRFISEVFYIDADMSTDTLKGDDYFVTGYLQYEQRLSPVFTAYGRVEEVYNENDSTALQVHTRFTQKGRVAGVRYDFSGNQALTIEAASAKKMSGKYVESISLKWNAVFP
jgi:hypothetical protein